MSLCHHCSAIASKLLFDEKDVIILGTSIKTHHQSFKDLEKSALTCFVCELLMERFRLLPLNDEWGEIYPEIWYTSTKRIPHGYDFRGESTLASGARSKDSKCLTGFDFWCRGNWATIDWYADEGYQSLSRSNFEGPSLIVLRHFSRNRQRCNWETHTLSRKL